MLSRLEQLPAELRNVIYTFTVIESPPLQIDNHATQVNAAQPPLARTNRRIRAEVLPIFYAENTFVARFQPARLCSNLEMLAVVFPVIKSKRCSVESSSYIIQVPGTLERWLSCNLPYLKHLRSFGTCALRGASTVCAIMSKDSHNTFSFDCHGLPEVVQECTCLRRKSADLLAEEKRLTPNRLKSIMVAANIST